ncbi:MAG TPA: NAD(P)-dependent oxidoreductase [Thermomicrobiales bacterium]|nr:NAD(P)-dependent oxidoreductase [Thermomicrobiales bacterium]
MQPDTLGFAGLGRMGGPMSRRLVEAGYPLLGFDVAGTSERLPDGADAAESIADLAARVDLLLLSVPDGAASREICRQIAATTDRRVRVLIDLSTIGIAAARQCAATLEPAGVAYVDAPVSGGVAGAVSGSLALMAGTTEALFAEMEPVLTVLARNRFRVGDEPGHGQAMKLVNNYASAAALAATAEATVFGARMGLDLATMVEILNVSSGRSTASEDKFPRAVVTGTYDFGFPGAGMAKDVRLYLESAVAAEVPHDLADTVAALWKQFSAAQPEADLTAIHRYFEQGG